MGSVSEAEFTKPSDWCAHPEWWHAPDNQATETEVSELVAAFVRALQPQFVLETGSHRGFTTSAIAAALRRNGHGRLVSLEISQAFAVEAAERVFSEPLPSGVSVEIVTGNSLEYVPTEPIDFAWLDSGGGTERYEELLRFFPYFHVGTVIGIHDTAPHQGDVRRVMDALAESKRFRSIELPTPRGVTFLQVAKGVFGG